MVLIKRRHRQIGCYRDFVVNSDGTYKFYPDMEV